MSQTDERRARILTMLVRAGANVDAPMPDTMTPLYAAIGRRNVELVKLLLLLGAHPDIVGCTRAASW